MRQICRRQRSSRVSLSTVHACPAVFVSWMQASVSALPYGDTMSASAAAASGAGAAAGSLAAAAAATVLASSAGAGEPPEAARGRLAAAAPRPRAARASRRRALNRWWLDMSVQGGLWTLAAFGERECLPGTEVEGRGERGSAGRRRDCSGRQRSADHGPCACPLGLQLLVSHSSRPSKAQDRCTAGVASCRGLQHTRAADPSAACWGWPGRACVRSLVAPYAC